MQAKIDAIAVHNDHEIKGFFGEYRWLSNFHLCVVQYEGLTYPSAENAYQAAKAPPAERQNYTTCTPSKAKGSGQRIELPANWNDARVEVMHAIVRAKFYQNRDLASKLVATGDRHLEETNWWKDRFWGVYSGTGLNYLGRILMGVRSDLRWSQIK